MNFRFIVSLLSGLAYMASSSFYVLGVAKAKIKPNIGSFLIWFFLNVSLLISLIAAHAWNILPFVIVATIGSGTVCTLSLKFKRFYFSKFDAIGTALGITGAIVWLLTRQAKWNIYIIALVNTITFIPLIVKTIRFPHYERALPWRFNFLGAILLIVSIPSTAVVKWIIPLQQFLCSATINIVLLGGFVGFMADRQKRGVLSGRADNR